MKIQRRDITIRDLAIIKPKYVRIIIRQNA